MDTFSAYQSFEIDGSDSFISQIMTTVNTFSDNKTSMHHATNFNAIQESTSTNDKWNTQRKDGC